VITPKQLFAKPDLPQSGGKIILWWEARRLHYNLIVFGWALLLGLVAALGFEAGNLWTPNFLVFYLFFFQLPANIFYTGGWIVELIVRKVLRVPVPGFGPWALGIGIAVSILFYVWVFVFVLVEKGVPG
jgi:hypothetical protein